MIMTRENDVMPDVMLHPHDIPGEAVNRTVQRRKCHVAAAASYYYIYMIQRGASGRFSAALNTGDWKI